MGRLTGRLSVLATFATDFNVKTYEFLRSFPPGVLETLRLSGFSAMYREFFCWLRFLAAHCRRILHDNNGQKTGTGPILFGTVVRRSPAGAEFGESSPVPSV